MRVLYFLGLNQFVILYVYELYTHYKNIKASHLHDAIGLNFSFD